MTRNEKRKGALSLLFVLGAGFLLGYVPPLFWNLGANSAPSGNTGSPTPTATIFANYIPVTFDDLLEDSIAIVYGEVMHVHPGRERAVAPSVTQVYTPITIAPLQTLKGRPFFSLTYNRMGGEFEGLRHRVDGDDRCFQPGDRVLVFLSKYYGDIGRASVFIERDGMITVWDDAGNYFPVEVSTREYMAKVREGLARKGL